MSYRSISGLIPDQFARNVEFDKSLPREDFVSVDGSILVKGGLERNEGDTLQVGV